MFSAAQMLDNKSIIITSIHQLTNDRIRSSRNYVFKGSCARWYKYDNQNGTEAFYQPHVDTEALCEKTCLAFPDCIALDWIPGESKKCHHHYTDKSHYRVPHTGSTYRKIVRNMECKGMIIENKSKLISRMQLGSHL